MPYAGGVGRFTGSIFRGRTVTVHRIENDEEYREALRTVSALIDLDPAPARWPAACWRRWRAWWSTTRHSLCLSSRLATPLGPRLNGLRCRFAL